MAKEIRLTNSSLVAIVDDGDYLEVSKHKWRLSQGGYACRGKIVDGKYAWIGMHRIICETPKGKLTDHIDGNRLNNTKANLRTCTLNQNAHNMFMSRRNTSGYKGVWKKRNRWAVDVSFGGERVFRKTFVNIIDAARAYDAVAKKYHGDFAKTNF